MTNFNTIQPPQHVPPQVLTRDEPKKNHEVLNEKSAVIQAENNKNLTISAKKTNHIVDERKSEAIKTHNKKAATHHIHSAPHLQMNAAHLSLQEIS